VLQTAEQLTDFHFAKTECSLNRSVSYSAHKQKRQPHVNPAAPPMHQQKSVMKSQSVVASPTICMLHFAETTSAQNPNTNGTAINKQMMVTTFIDLQLSLQTK